MSFIKLQVRRDTAANWTSANPILSAGEIGFETDTGKFKMGNGATAWASLVHFEAGAGGGGGGSDTAAQILAKLITVDGAASGLDADLVRGTTPGATGLSILAGATAAAVRTVLGLGTMALEAAANYLTTAAAAAAYQPLDADTLKSDVSANLTAGYSATQVSLGTIASGTVTPAFANGNEQKYTNNGAHTLAPATLTAGRATSITVEITNGASAGVITTSGFTKVIGDAFTTTNGHKFKCFIHIGDAASLLNVVALQ
jgi:hypothetical protein